MRLAEFLLIIILLLAVTHTASAFKPESVVIYENPGGNDFIEIYTTKPDVIPLLKPLIQIKKVEVDKKDNYTIFTVYTSLGEKTGVFERRVSGKILKGLSSLGKVYIYIDKGCNVKGRVRLIKSEEFRNLYEVLGYEDIIYRLKSGTLYGLLITNIFLILNHYTDHYSLSNCSSGTTIRTITH